ncbi:MAG: LPXTG cell wall anchor domain-containing protein, partial [Xanthomonadales bacterium]|nr:LPXTG cell wall anchor domain-containing protein [Xanthomonadales bacterium]
MLGNIGFGVLGLAALLGLAWLFSCNRRQVDW